MACISLVPSSQRTGVCTSGLSRLTAALASLLCWLHSGSDLEFFLIQPIQRLPRYVMLVAELIKHTPEGLEARAVLEELHKEVRGCCACVVQ